MAALCFIALGATGANAGPAGQQAAVERRADSLELVLRVVDADDGLPLRARCCATDCDGTPRYPLPAQSCFFHEAHWTHPAHFYTCGVCTLQVPQGVVRIMVSRGFEYAALRDSVDVARDTCVVCTLSRWADMAQANWFSGDCHVHIAHGDGVYDVYPEDARLVAESEGMNVINCLDAGHCFTGGPDPCSTAECIVYMSQEKRSRVYGHSGLLGITSLIHPTCYTTWWPLIMDMADEVHAQPGALVTCAHPMSTWDIFDIDSVGGRMLAREVPVDVIGGKVDAYELLCRQGEEHCRNVHMWYQILNCGFRLPACAGTDACVDRNWGPPAGGYKTYVDVTGEFSFGSWLQGLADGRTVVTNGPLFTDFSVSGLTLGDSLDIVEADSAKLDGSLSVICSTPLLRVDVVVNGKVDQALFPSGDGTRIDADFSVTLDRSSWVAARAVGIEEHCFTCGDSLWAHTGPVYFTLNGRRIVEIESAEYLAHWVAQIETLALTRGEWDAPAESLRVMEELAYARGYYDALADGAATGVHAGDSAAEATGDPGEDQVVGTAALIGPNRPNPFGVSTTIPFYVPCDGDAALRILAPSGRLVCTLPREELPAGWHSAIWDGRNDGGQKCGAGIYFCRLAAGGSVATRKIVVLR